jgi:hypothetical protein
VAGSCECGNEPSVFIIVVVVNISEGFLEGP